MIKSNSIFEAMGNIDDEIAANAVKSAERSKRKKPIMLAAASLAAALAIAVGIRNWGGIIGNYISPADSPVNQSGATYQGEEWTSTESVSPVNGETMKIKLRKGDNTDYGIEFNLTLQDYTIPEEYLSSNIFGFESGHTDTVPSELFPKFGITMLTSDNFTDTKSVKERIHDKNGNIYSWEPSVCISSMAKVDTQICLEYFLYDKKIDRNIRFTSFYISDINFLEMNKKFGYGINSDTEIDAEVVTLNDGSQCVVTDSEAFFSYNGVRYNIRFDHDGLGSSIEELKQVLIDLEIYTPTADTN